MSIYKFDHIAIVVDNLNEALEHFRSLFEIRDADLIYERDYEDLNPESGQAEVMHFALFPVGQVYLELVEPVSEGPVRKFLDRTGGGVHHIGITSDNLRDDWASHSAKRDKLGIVGDLPRVDQYDVSYWFLHPSSNYNTLFEVDAAWAKTSASDMTPIEPTPDWRAD